MQQLLLLIPVPPMFERALWYPAHRRHIGIYWDCLFDDCVVSDGAGDYIASSSAWNAFRNHQKVAGALRTYHFGTAVDHPQHMLVLDRDRRRFFVMEYTEAERMLSQQPGTQQPEPTRKTTLTVVASNQRTDLQQPLVTHDTVNEIMKQSRGLELAMTAWLNEH